MDTPFADAPQSALHNHINPC